MNLAFCTSIIALHFNRTNFFSFPIAYALFSNLCRLLTMATLFTLQEMLAKNWYNLLGELGARFDPLFGWDTRWIITG